MDKDALVNVAYNETEVSSCATMRHNNIFNFTLIFIMPASARDLQVSFYTFCIVRPGLEPATSRSESGRSTN